MATIYYTASTLDGYIADPHGSLDWLFGRDRDEGTAQSYESFIGRVGAVCLGRGTFDWVLSHHPEMAREPMYEQPVWLVTRRPVAALPPGTRTYAGDVRELHREMTEAAGGRDLWVVGGGDLAGQFADAGLLDEVWVQVAPVTVGGGSPLLPRRIELEPLEVERNRDFVDLRYRVRREGR